MSLTERAGGQVVQFPGAAEKRVCILTLARGPARRARVIEVTTPANVRLYDVEVYSLFNDDVQATRNISGQHEAIRLARQELGL